MKLNQYKAGVVISYLGQFIQILISLIYTPVMLKILGQSEYGLYQLVFSVVSYLSLLSLGFGSSYMRFYSRFNAQKNEDEISKLNGIFMIIFCSLSLICIICGYFMVKNIYLIFGTGLTKSEYKLAKTLMTLLIINMALTFPNSVFNCVITAHEKFFYQKLIILFQHLLNPFLALPLLILGYGSVGMVSVTTLLTLFVLISNAYYCFRKLNINFKFKNLSFSFLKEMWIFTFFIFLNQIIDQLNWSIDKFLLGRLVGTSAVAIYGVGAQINTMYLQFSTAISNVFIPKVNKIVAESNDSFLLTKLFTKIGRVQFIILALALLGFTFFGLPFINFWAGKEYNQAYIITLLLIGPVTIPLIQNLGLEIQRAKNMHQARSVVYFFIALGNVFISIPLIKLMGPIGAALGTAISLICGNVLFMNWYYHKKIGLNIFYYWKEIFKFFPALVLPIIFGLYFKYFISFDTFIKFFIYVCIYIIIYFLSMYFFGLNYSEKQLIITPVKKIVSKIKIKSREE